MLLNAFLTGAITAASLVVALVFLRFWRSSHDRFFLFFSFAFALEALSRAWLGMRQGIGEDSPVIYLPRLLAYVLILIAIVDKNRRPPARSDRERNR